MTNEQATKTFDATDIKWIVDVMKSNAQFYKSQMVTPITHDNSMIIAGGCFTRWYHSDKDGDIDIFILDDGTSRAKLKSFFANDDTDRFKKGNSDYLNNVTHGKIISTFFDRKTKMQYIFTGFKTRRELVDHFDMLHCCVSYDMKEDKLYISLETFNAIALKKIAPNKNNTIASWRLKKMYDRGWSENAKSRIDFITKV